MNLHRPSGPTGRVRRAALLVGAIGLSTTLAACADDSSSTSIGVDTPEETLKVAYLSASSANTWLASSLVAMETVAEAENVELTEFDAQFKPGEQAKQIQDIIATGDYDGLVIASVDGAGIIPDLEAAIDAGIEVAILNQVIGTRLDTANPQFDDVAVSVLAPPQRSGERLGQLTLQACEGISPCNVVYFYGIKGTPIDTAVREGFDAKVAENPEISVVAEAEGKYLGPDESLKAMQDLIQKDTDIDVVVGADQSIQGAQLALEDAGVAEDVKLVGFGGSEAAIAGIKSGAWYADLFGAPATEGRLALEALVQAMRGGEPMGGIDTATQLPDEGLVTQDNVDDFVPEWAG
jgi:ribose transport system substrate-binding protein